MEEVDELDEFLYGKEEKTEQEVAVDDELEEGEEINIKSGIKPAEANTVENKSFLDIQTSGKLEDGRDIIDVDPEELEEKPWRKPGADITDYFNYGFTEQTWKQYCQKQRRIRDDYGHQKRIYVADANNEEYEELNERSYRRSPSRERDYKSRTRYHSSMITLTVTTERAEEKDPDLQAMTGIARKEKSKSRSPDRDDYRSSRSSRARH
ncbi:Pre-mRNA polyadenylation factor Fip1 domain-containing protein [Rozella allomycis CSF55]|uniref:Pre-mRNA polyadenylation factor Fip1 domain-containing protein n=1 Tax=Rozella allomycis (strain CSF55) TaxID=988480 RepID=A0A075AU16_ROZAC|nr:Pre-mRNA polyadenylation factor Fip1 domain-containing protein [Rozella allomycis CSF55]|eukprot:EPZ33758.1 Pre-mRNA polyadenylation factor Fip1 domain-containing protein [Rozella allomycis CSF55]